MAKKTGSDEKIISALLACGSLAEVSAATNTPPRTLYTIMHSSNFRKKLNAAKSDMLGQSVVKLNGYTSMCVDILAEIARDTEQNGQVRVSACRSLLDMAGRYNEQIDIIQRIEELERNSQNLLQAENSRKNNGRGSDD